MKAASLRVGILLAALITLTASTATAQFTGSRNVTLLSTANDYTGPQSAFGSSYSACWSYVHGDGREYAVIGTVQGTLIYNVTNPAMPILRASIPGPQEGHREMKSYRNWIYVVTEGASLPNPGIQIIRMTNPESPVLVGTYAATFNRSHTITIDTTRALLICNGTRKANGDSAGIRILSLANPEAPVEVGAWPGGTAAVRDSQYVHDSEVFGTRLYAASMSIGAVRVIDISNPTAPVHVETWLYPGASETHSTALDRTGTHLYVCDEAVARPLSVLDILPVLPAGLPDSRVVYEFKPMPQPVTAGNHVIHNPRVRGDELFLASYTEGVRILDISDPAFPAEFGWAVSYQTVPPNWWYGVWEVCPHFPSGIFIASHMQLGLFVYRPVRDYGLLKVEVVDATSNLPVPGATARLVEQGDVLMTAGAGVAHFGPSPGTHTIEVTHSYYLPHGTEVRTVTAGSRQTVRFALLRGGGGGGGPGRPIYDVPLEDARSGNHGLVAAVGRLAFERPAPNPFRGHLQLVLAVPMASLVEVEVFDVGGRIVSTLHRGPTLAGRLSLAWDGRDGSGRPVRAGIYHARARSGDEQATVRFVLTE